MYSTKNFNPRLLIDVGSTYARFALETATGVLEHHASFLCAQYPDFFTAVTAYLNSLNGINTQSIKHAAVAIPTPVAGDQVRMTNYHWHFSIEEMRQQLKLDNLLVVNDFTALAMALPNLPVSERRQIGGGTAEGRSVIGLIGAGSGLGVSGLIPAGDGWVALGTEGGHTSFSPQDEREIEILQFAWKEQTHVSFERLVSGPGLELIYRALAQRNGVATQDLSAPEISHKALGANDTLCLETIDVFCGMLGTAAANLAVTQGAFGGIYIGGNIVPRLGRYFDQSVFRERFERKGRFADYMRRIPTYVITSQDATLIGASIILSSQLNNLSSAQNTGILNQLQRVRENLSPAEQRVADHIMAHPRQTLNDAISTIASSANVSQPTVIRFCRSLGYEGLSDFKLRLAAGLSGNMPITHAQVTGEDTPIELGAKVLGNTASAILQIRNHLNRESIDKAIRLIAGADRIDFYASGYYSVVADDAQFKFLRMGIAAGSYTVSRMQALNASVSTAGSVLVIISNKGNVPELLDVVDRAKLRGGTVIAITASHSPLARASDLTLIVDHAEDSATQIPMISRVLYLLMIDILVVGVAMQREGKNINEIGQDADLPMYESDITSPIANRSSLGVSAAGALAHLTSHSQ